jgi:hypothetical protein
VAVGDEASRAATTDVVVKAASSERFTECMR